MSNIKKLQKIVRDELLQLKKINKENKLILSFLDVKILYEISKDNKVTETIIEEVKEGVRVREMNMNKDDLFTFIWNKGTDPIIVTWDRE